MMLPSSFSPFRVAGIFDNNFNKIGRQLWDLEILDVQRLAKANKELKASIGMVAVPADAAQEAVDLLVKAGLRAILNFAPTHIDGPEGVALRTVDLTRELEVLSYFTDLPPAEAEDSSGN